MPATSTAPVVRARLAADGAFRFDLARGHTYSLSVVLSIGSEPVVFPRVSKRLDTTFRIKTGAAVVDLGAVRHALAASAAVFVQKSTTLSVSQGLPPPRGGANRELIVSAGASAAG